jgi:hypothetical protein
MQRLCRAATLIEAHMLRDLLAHAGIDAVVLNENATGALGEVPFTSAWPEVWLRDRRDAAGADVIVRAARRDPGPAERPCVGCGAANPIAFELCWSCGAATGA